MVFVPQSINSRSAFRPRKFKPVPNSLRSGRFGTSGMINMTLDEVRGLFWDPTAVDTAVDKAAFRANQKAAAYCRTVARRSMKWRTRYKSVNSIRDPEKKKHYVNAVIAWKIRGANPKFEPKLPYPSAPKGQPPFAIREAKRGLLRRFLFSATMRESRNAVIGPISLRRRAVVPGLHEYGGSQVKGRRKPVTVRYGARRYMRRARDITIPKMLQFWHNQVRRG